MLLAIGLGAVAGFAAGHFGIEYAQHLKDSSVLAYVVCEDPMTTKITAGIAGGAGGMGIYGLVKYIFSKFSGGKKEKKYEKK